MFSNNNSYEFDRYSIPYNVPRSGKLSITKNGNPIMSISVAQRERIGLPITKDGAWERFNQLLHYGYTWSSFRTRRLAAVTVLTRRGVEKQIYLGRDIYNNKGIFPYVEVSYKSRGTKEKIRRKRRED